MIELSKLNGDRVVVNERWIETIEALPDTTITVSSGNKFVVLEPMAVVMEKIIDWKVKVTREAVKPKMKKNAGK
jgi:flagellar protein FlbD